MKIKTLFFSAAIGVASVLPAQNLVVNGDFEAIDYVDVLDGQTYSLHTWVRSNPSGYHTSYVPGWDRRTDTNGNLVPIVTKDDAGEDVWELYNAGGGNKWNVFWGIVEHEGLGELITPDNYQYLDIRRYQDDGWQSHDRLTQTINVKPNQKYDISFLYTVPQMNEKKGSAAIDRNISVYDVADVDNPIYQFLIADDVNYVDWTKITTDFTTPASCTQIQLKVGLRGSYKGESGKNNIVGLNVDNFVITEFGSNSVKENIDSKVAISRVGSTVQINGANIGDKLAILNLVGQEIHQSTVTSETYTLSTQISQGIYVVKINNKTLKVVL